VVQHNEYSITDEIHIVKSNSTEKLETRRQKLERDQSRSRSLTAFGMTMALRRSGPSGTLGTNGSGSGGRRSRSSGRG